MELSKLKRRDGITFLKTEKTGKIIVMPRKDYVNKMLKTIEGMKVVKLKRDPNPSLIDKTKAIIKDPNWPKHITFNFNAASVTLRLVGRLKDHKNPYKIKPTVNKSEEVTYQLEKIKKNVYNEILPASENALATTQEFIKRFSEINIDKNDILVNFDVKELYPSVDTTEIANVVNEKVEEKFGKKQMADLFIR